MANAIIEGRQGEDALPVREEETEEEVAAAEAPVEVETEE